MSQMALGTETRNLLRYLNAQREHIFGILEGLGEDALRRPVLPSEWSCLGLVQHLALDVERFWFRCTVASEQDAIDSLATIDNAWQVGASAPVEAIFDLYRQEIARANAIIAATPPDAAPAWWPAEFFGDWRLDTVREIILHVMTETACHAGHLDVVREQIDGRQWLIMTN
jgi:hypothetical protein